LRPPTLKDNESVDNAVWLGDIRTISVLRNGPGAQALWALVLFVIGELIFFRIFYFGLDGGLMG
jgi:hypothetical protein